MSRLRAPGESYSDVILRLAAPHGGHRLAFALVGLAVLAALVWIVASA